MTRNASHGSRLSANNLPQDLCAGWPQIVWQLAVPSTDEGTTRVLVRLRRQREDTFGQASQHQAATIGSPSMKL